MQDYKGQPQTPLGQVQQLADHQPRTPITPVGEGQQSPDQQTRIPITGRQNTGGNWTYEDLMPDQQMAIGYQPPQQDLDQIRNYRDTVREEYRNADLGSILDHWANKARNDEFTYRYSRDPNLVTKTGGIGVDINMAPASDPLYMQRGYEQLVRALMNPAMLQSPKYRELLPRILEYGAQQGYIDPQLRNKGENAAPRVQPGDIRQQHAQGQFEPGTYKDKFDGTDTFYEANPRQPGTPSTPWEGAPRQPRPGVQRTGEAPNTRRGKLTRAYDTASEAQQADINQLFRLWDQIHAARAADQDFSKQQEQAKTLFRNLRAAGLLGRIIMAFGIGALAASLPALFSALGSAAAPVAGAASAAAPAAASAAGAAGAAGGAAAGAAPLLSAMGPSAAGIAANVGAGAAGVPGVTSAAMSAPAAASALSAAGSAAPTGIAANAVPMAAAAGNAPGTLPAGVSAGLGGAGKAAPAAGGMSSKLGEVGKQFGKQGMKMLDQNMKQDRRAPRAPAPRGGGGRGGASAQGLGDTFRSSLRKRRYARPMLSSSNLLQGGRGKRLM